MSMFQSRVFMAYIRTVPGNKVFSMPVKQSDWPDLDHQSPPLDARNRSHVLHIHPKRTTFKPHPPYFPLELSTLAAELSHIDDSVLGCEVNNRVGRVVDCQGVR